MKRDVTEQRVFCDFCDRGKETLARSKCLVCGKDICDKHSLDISVRLDASIYGPGFRAFLCPIDSLAIASFMKVTQGCKGTWESAGHNPEYNQARHIEIMDQLAAWEKQAMVS